LCFFCGSRDGKIKQECTKKLLSIQRKASENEQVKARVIIVQPAEKCFESMQCFNLGFACLYEMEKKLYNDSSQPLLACSFSNALVAVVKEEAIFNAASLLFATKAEIQFVFNCHSFKTRHCALKFPSFS
jgi:hypothetical protein